METADTIFFADLIQAVQSLVQELNLNNGYRLITNGGKYQDVPHLQLHLIAGETAPRVEPPYYDFQERK